MPDVLVRHLGLRGLALHSDCMANDRFRWVARNLPSELRDRVVLDAGCGNGMFTMLAAQRGASALGLSDSQPELESATRRAALLGLPHAHFEVQDLRLLAARTDINDVDVVLCLEVIEHVLDDALLLRQLGQRARPGARLLLTTPTDDHPAVFGEEAHLSGIEDGRHVRWGSSRERLREMCRSAGWDVQSVDKVSGPMSRRITSVTYRLGERSRGLAWGVTLPLRPACALDSLLLRRAHTKSHCWGVVASRI